MNIYLVHEDWTNKIKNFYKYDLIKEKIDIRWEVSIHNLEQILKELKLFELYIGKQTIKHKDPNIFKSVKSRPNFSKKLISNQEIKFPIDFDIIDKNIYENLIQNDDNQGGINSECIINSEKIIIKFIEENKGQFFLIIGNFDINTNKFCNELLLNYNIENKKNHLKCLNYHFNLLRVLNFQNFVNNTFSEDKKILYFKNIK